MLPKILVLLLVLQIYPVNANSAQDVPIALILQSPGFYDDVTIEGYLVDIQIKLGSWKGLRIADVITVKDDTGILDVYSPCGLHKWELGTFVRVTGRVEKTYGAAVVRMPVNPYPYTLPDRCLSILR